MLINCSSSKAQCPGGYTSATVNWDNLDYLHRNGSIYGGTNPVTGLPYVTTAMVQTQYFAIGTNRLAINTAMPIGGSSSLSGDVTTHTGDAGATGADIHYIPNANGQTITMTFQSEVQNATFTLNDIDRSAVYTITATNASSAAQSITVTTYASTILTIGGSATARTITASNTNPGYTVNTGAATITVAGPVQSIVVTATTIGSNAEIFLSDITACVANPGFPTNYYSPYTEPFTNQPGYFLASAQNLTVYMVDPATGSADALFSDPGTSGTRINSIAYDPINHWVYYVMDNNPTPPSNLTVKKYDLSTGIISTVISNIATFGIPSFIQGIEYAGAAFYNGSLYLGIEGTDGISFSTNTESIIWKIDFDASGNATTYTQVFGTLSDNGSGSPSHDWGDFVIKDGLIITHATGPTSALNHYIHYNMQTGGSTTYAGGSSAAGQLAQTYNGNVYKIKNDIALYNNNGTVGSSIAITTTSCSAAWTGDAEDASDPFKPKCDFGDAPSSYDPVALSPAANQKACNNSTLRIGSAWGDEWSKATSSDASGDDEEDGIGTVNVMVSDGGPYNHVQDVTVLNNTGATAYLAGWLDYDADGIFEASEAVVVTVPSSSVPQTISLSWAGITVAPGTPNSFLRVRLYSGTLTANDATGWFSDGETEDYPVISQSIPLAIQLLDFKAILLEKGDALLNWQATADYDDKGFVIERSSDLTGWERIGQVSINTSAHTSSYYFSDHEPLQGRSYYRLKMIERSGSSKYSPVRMIQLDKVVSKLKIYPNPARNDAFVSFQSTTRQSATLLLLSMTGEVVAKKPVVLVNGENRIPIQSTNMNTGLYVVELRTPEKTYINRLSVTH